MSSKITSSDLLHKNINFVTVFHTEFLGGLAFVESLAVK